MPGEDSIGKFYAEIGVRKDQLQKELDEVRKSGENSAKAIEKEFQKTKVELKTKPAREDLDKIVRSYREFTSQRLGANIKEMGSFGAGVRKTAQDWGAYKEQMRAAGIELDNVDDKLDEAGNSAKAAGQGTEGFVKSLLKVAGTYIGIQKISQFLKSSITESIEAAKAFLQVEQAVKRTGAIAGFTAYELKGIADELEEIAGIDGDQIFKEITLQLLTFTRVSGTEFKRAQEAVLDLAAVIGTDLTSQSIQLGKALEDPISGLTALRRVGVTFTDSQEQMIKKFMAQNQLAKAQGVILDEIEAKYGGQARALNQATNGVMTAEVAWGNLKEAVGDLFGPLLSSWLPSVTQAIKGWTSLLKDAGEEFRNFLKAGSADRQASFTASLQGSTEEFRASQKKKAEEQLKVYKQQWEEKQKKIEELEKRGLRGGWRIKELESEQKQISINAATQRDYLKAIENFGKEKKKLDLGKSEEEIKAEESFAEKKATAIREEKERAEEFRAIEDTKVRVKKRSTAELIAEEKKLSEELRKGTAGKLNGASNEDQISAIGKQRDISQKKLDIVRDEIKERNRLLSEDIRNHAALMEERRKSEGVAESRILELKKKYYEDTLAFLKEGSDEYKRQMEEILMLAEKIKTARKGESDSAGKILSDMNDKEERDRKKRWDGQEEPLSMDEMESDIIRFNETTQAAYSSMADGFSEAFDLIQIKTRETDSVVVRSAANMANSFIRSVEQMLAKWLAFEALKAGIGLFFGSGASEGFAGLFGGGKPKGHFGGDFANYGRGIMKMARGGSFIVPPGFNNDSFPLLVESGERVHVTPASQVNNFNSDNSALASKLDAVNASIIALNMNLIRKDFSFNGYFSFDERKFVRDNIKPIENSFTRGGVKLD